LPVADVLVPNAFELRFVLGPYPYLASIFSEIMGLPCSTQDQCLHAIKETHKKYGIKYVVVTSGTEKKQDNELCCHGSVYDEGILRQFRFDIPRIHGHYVGTGDVFASLLLAWLSETNGNIELSIKNVIASLQALIKRTAEKAYGKIVDPTAKPSYKHRELCLIESRYDLLMPAGVVNSIHL
jgi:pyridoxine kinase